MIESSVERHRHKLITISNVWVLTVLCLGIDICYSVLRCYFQQTMPIMDVGNCSTEYGGSIGVLLFVDSEENYQNSINNWRCYTELKGYQLFTVTEDAVPLCNNVTNLFFRRHCVARLFVAKVDWLLFVDADTVVVNFSPCIQDFIDNRYAVIHYERYFSGEVAAGSYLINNSVEAKNYLNSWLAYEQMLSTVVFHNMDNGVLQLHVLRTMIGVDQAAIRQCEVLFMKSKWLANYFTFLGCAKRLRANAAKDTDRATVKILAPLKGWVRDSWLTNYYWSEKDFILHGFKRQSAALARYSAQPCCSEWPTPGFWPNCWPNKMAYFVGTDQLQRILTTTAKRTARYHPDVFPDSHLGL